MANSKACGTCKRYWPLERGLKDGTKQLTRGYCLAKTIFPAGRVGKRVLPPRARVEETENDRIISHIVQEKGVVLHCNEYATGRQTA